MTLDPAQVAAVGSIIGALIVAGIKRVWVFGWVYDRVIQQLVDMTKDRDFWRDMALRSMGNTDKALDIRKPDGA